MDSDTAGSVTSMKGIEYFTELTELSIPDGAITTLDLSQNSELETVSLYGCASMTDLNVRGLSELTSLNVRESYALTGLDLKGCTALTELDAGYCTALSSLSVGSCAKLQELWCNDDALTSLDLSACSALIKLICSGNSLDSLDVSGCSELTYLDCSVNSLASLDLSANFVLLQLLCGYNQLKELDLSWNGDLLVLDCPCNGMTELKLSDRMALTYLDCAFNSLTGLDVKTAADLEILHCQYNKIKSLDVGVCKALEGLWCQGNALTRVGVWNCPKLAEVTDSDHLSIVTDFDYEGNYVGVVDWYTDDTSSDGGMKVDHGLQVLSEAIYIQTVQMDRSAAVMYVGDSMTLKASVLPEDDLTASVRWYSSDEKVAEVENGVVKAVAAGSATITAKSVADSSFKATCKVTVQAKVSNRNLKKRGSNGTATVNIGKQLQLVPTFATKEGWTVKKYRSSSRRVASVTDEGLVTAKKAGKATITVTTKNGKSATLKVEVQDPTVPKKISIREKASVKLGSTLQLVATVSPDTAVSDLKWKTSNRRVATVTQSGLVKPVKAGVVYITVKTANDKSARVKVTVVDPTVPTKVVLSPSGTTKLKVDATLQLVATMSPDTAVSELKWSSSNKRIAKVSSDGLVTALKKGTATITVRTKKGGKSARVKIKVQ